MRFDVSFLPALAAAFLLTFARVGAMVMLLPGIGEMNVPSRIRLAIELMQEKGDGKYAADLKQDAPIRLQTSDLLRARCAKAKSRASS